MFFPQVSLNKCFVLKFVLQLPRIKDHMNTIGIDQSLINSDIFEHRCLQNIKKLYQHSEKCGDQQQLKDILQADMVYTPEGFIKNSPISTMNPSLVNKLSARKSLCIFTNILDAKDKSAIRRIGYAKSNPK